MDQEVRWERMFPDQLEAAFAARPVVYFGYGLCEPHGPHCTVGLDALKAHGILVAAAKGHGGIVAPPDYWHIHEIGRYAIWGEREIGAARPWLTAVPPWVHFKNLCYHARAADRLGFRAGIFLTGHYGPNWRDLHTMMELLQPHLRVRIAGMPDFEINTVTFDGADGDHAGKVETSLLWALEPDCVDPSRLPSKVEKPLFAAGYDAPEADRRQGEAMVEGMVAALGGKVEELLDTFDPDQPRRLRTFDDVEDFWRREVEPRLADFKSIRGGWSEDDAPPEGSPWREGWLPRIFHRR